MVVELILIAHLLTLGIILSFNARIVRLEEDMRRRRSTAQLQ